MALLFPALLCYCYCYCCLFHAITVLAVPAPPPPAPTPTPTPTPTPIPTAGTAAANEAAAAAAARPTASIDSGLIVGTTVLEPASGKPVVRYLGIPFGRIPQRFRPATRPEPWNASSSSSPYDASTYRPACIQKFAYPEEARRLTMQWFNTPPPPAGDGEDCLNLNIYAPLPPPSSSSSPSSSADTLAPPAPSASAAAGGKGEQSSAGGGKPVLFWLFGGGFNFGTGALPLYDGTSFAANQDIIVVTSNYRTNVFGFPGSPDIPKSEQNLGFLDQRLALDWVRRNIAAVGGDPDKITIVGESAGAGSVDTLITTPPSPLPFRGAILQSGQASIIGKNNDSAASWEKLARLADCPPGESLSCLRGVPAARLNDLVERAALPFGPVQDDDGATWTSQGRKARLTSNFLLSRIARVPVLIGTNADEGLTFVYPANDTERYFAERYPQYKDRLVALADKHYPVGSPGIPDAFRQISTMLTDFTMQCPAKVFASDDRFALIPTWRYFFDAGFANTQIFDGSGAWHSSEVPLVFGTYPRQGATPYQMELSSRMQAAWADFVRDPRKGPGWDMAPKLAHIGGGVRPDNDLDKVPGDMIKTVDPQELDRRCYLYRGVYDLVTLL